MQLKIQRIFVYLLFFFGASLSLFSQPTPLPVRPGQSLTLLYDGTILASGGLLQGQAVNTAYRVDTSGHASQIPSGLIAARTGHSETALPDGTVLIFGGTDGNGHYVRSMEIFDPRSSQFTQWTGMPLVPRASHTATLLTDGRVVVIGGTGEGGAFAGDIQTWDYRTGSIESLGRSPLFPRQGHSATLLADGSILISGGFDRRGNTVREFELYYSRGQTFQAIGTNPPFEEDQRSAFHLEATMPKDGAEQFPIAEIIKLRFSRLVNLSTVSQRSIVLTATDGSVISATTAAAEQGRLAFLIPSTALLPNTSYSLEVQGVLDLAGDLLPASTIQFHTAGDADDGAADGWVPDFAARNGNWNSRTDPSDWQKLPALKAPNGVTALSGQVLGISGKPLAHVTLQIENNSVQSDNSGRFLLRNLLPGRQILIIDGATANKRSVEYGQYEVSVETKAGVTTTLNYTIWMTKLDTEHAVRISSPTTAADTVIQSPLLPGLELHLPAGTKIVGRNGKAISQLTITPIPLDKPPFPLPTGLRVPLYFTIQPGLSEIRIQGSGAGAKGAQLFYPNSFAEPSGTIYNFWNYDAASKGWYVYGNGYVTSNKQQIKPNPGVYVYELTGAMVGGGTAKNAIAGGGPRAGDPVSLSSGQFVNSVTDLAMTDTIPIQLVRTYTTNDHYQRPFGIGTTDNYDMFTVGDTFPYTYQELITPDGSAIRFNRTSAGTDYANAVYTSSASQGPWYGATIYWNSDSNVPVHGSVWILRTLDNMKYGFPDAFNINSQTRQAVLGYQDRNGNTVTLTRDPNGNLTKITSPMGRYISLSYDPLNRITSATDSIGRTVSYTYDVGGHLGTVTDVNGGVTTYAYNSNDQLTSITDARGITYLTNQYDSFGRVTQQTQADGSTYLFAWTPSANSVQQWVTSTNPVNRYDPGTYAGYTSLIAQVSITDPRGYVRQVAFNNFGMTSSDTKAFGQPEQQSDSFQYYSDNLLKSSSDTLGRVTLFDYDATGNPISVTRLAGTSDANTSTSNYDQNNGNLLSITDPLSHTTTFSYDGSGNLIKTQDPLGHSVTIAYDNSNGRPSSVVDSIGNAVTFSYVGGDLVSVTDPLGNQTLEFPDAAGRTIAVADPLGGSTQYQYDNMNRLTMITNAQGHQAVFTYDQNGNELTYQDFQGHTTHYTYDSMDRPSTWIDPLQRTSTTTYDMDGNPVSSIDRKGQITSRTFDGLGRNVYVGYGAVTSNGTTVYQSNVTYLYDGASRMTAATDSTSGIVSRTYDSLDRLINESTPLGNIAYTYDPAGRRVTAHASTSSLTTYSYDDANRLLSITQGSSQVGFSYDAANRRTALSLPNGVNVQYGYNENSNLSSIRYSTGTVLLGDLQYSYDAARRKTAVNGGSAHTNLPFALGQATYDDANQMNSWQGISLTYDANGNTVTDISGNQYIWNARNQLTGIVGSTNATFSYDAFGRRVTKVFDGQSTSHLYDGVNRVAEIGPTSTAVLLPAGIDEYFLRSDSNGNTVPLSDALGSTIGTTDTNGSLVASYWYDPYGSTTVSGFPTTDATQYAGRENDNTGLYYYRARYYNPGTGRFLSEDPAGFGGSGPNLYAYASGSPTNLIDPLGLKDSASPWQVGWEWLTGTGPRVHNFTDGDPFTELLRHHQHIQDLINDICNGTLPPSGRYDYNLGGLGGVPKYLQDYSTFFSYGLTGNIAVTYLGSYGLSYSASNGSLDIQVWNSSTIASATHPPVVGYTKWWNNNIGNRLNDSFSSGPMSATTQNFNFHEKLSGRGCGCK